METKTCTKCNATKEICQFSRRDPKAKRKNTWCKSCVNINSKKNYNSEKAIARNKLHRKRNREFAIDYLSKHPCIDCGETDVVVLDFDHVKGKKRNDVSKMILSGVSILTLQTEIAKCEVRCANDHRRKTHRERQVPCSSMDRTFGSDPKNPSSNLGEGAKKQE